MAYCQRCLQFDRFLRNVSNCSALFKVFEMCFTLPNVVRNYKWFASCQCLKMCVFSIFAKRAAKTFLLFDFERISFSLWFIPLTESRSPLEKPIASVKSRICSSFFLIFKMFSPANLQLEECSEAVCYSLRCGRTVGNNNKIGEFTLNDAFSWIIKLYCVQASLLLPACRSAVGSVRLFLSVLKSVGPRRTLKPDKQHEIARW